MYQGDNLAILLFCLSCTVIFVMEGGKSDTQRAKYSCWAVAALFAFLGFGWPHISEQIWPPLKDWVTTIATNPVAWFVILMFGLAILRFSPPKQSRVANLERQIKEIFSELGMDDDDSPDATAPSAPDPASVQFMIEARKFVFSSLEDVIQTYLTLIADFTRRAKAERKVRIIDMGTERTVRRDFSKLKSLVENSEDAETIDYEISNFLEHIYSFSQTILRSIMTAAEVSSDFTLMREWLEADKKALAELRDLRTSPLAENLKEAFEENSMAMQTAQGQAWMKQSSA